MLKTIISRSSGIPGAVILEFITKPQKVNENLGQRHTYILYNFFGSIIIDNEKSV